MGEFFVIIEVGIICIAVNIMFSYKNILSNKGKKRPTYDGALRNTKCWIYLILAVFAHINQLSQNLAIFVNIEMRIICVAVNIMFSYNGVAE